MTTYKGYIGRSRWQYETTEWNNIFILSYFYNSRSTKRVSVTIPEHSTLDNGYYFTDSGKAIPIFIFKYLWREAQLAAGVTV